HVRFADRLSVLVVGASADQPLLDLEFGDAFLVEAIDNLFEFGHNLGADAIARKEQKLERRHGPSRCVGESGSSARRFPTPAKGWTCGDRPRRNRLPVVWIEGVSAPAPCCGGG